MEECSAMLTTNGGDPDVESSPQPKPVDSSVSFVYSWMFSFIASVFNSISINEQTEQSPKFEFIEDKENTFIKNISTIHNNQNNNSQDNIVYKQPRKTNFFSPATKRKNDENNNLDNNGQQSTLATNPMDFFSIYNQSLVLPACKKTLILDLDETLVHSTLTPVNHHHLTVNVTVEDVACTFYVIKRPHVDYFLERVAEWYDIVVFTASMKEYADPLLDKLDTNRLIKHRLFRESCLEKEGNFVKDLSLIHQDLATTIIVDNSPHAYSNNVENALPIDNFMGDNPLDESLLTLLPFLEVLRYVNDVRSILGLRLANHQKQ
ncbi:dullard-like phosphatase domain containing protein [Cavenderia fasciculata]|uniref:Dullard-like phosphatase domain containing protein n=1 Tax=Cavenderia fasciculata TaxID=261658 RepID=F4PLA0_CACFS|nr:dullard-like phosphatase domain containing protein [Cavenderia fasciculata]EGG23322.1 dullard-like phosphatase domain containing protein [Cavenderia fasciculata]|eukprot:XP_004361173.1 dullard-like phosphatase domain containing protein [Cavenderia fasciculata]